MAEIGVCSIIAFGVNGNSFIHKSLILNQLKSNKFEFGRNREILIEILKSGPHSRPSDPFPFKER